MATPQLSPGVLIREVDLTVGRADNVLDTVGAFAGPFPIGPVNSPVDIFTEKDLINVFGKPQEADSQYEYWMSASSFLSYGGSLKVVRTSGDNLNNANAGVNESYETGLHIDNYDDYLVQHVEGTNFIFAAKNPGTWANGLKVCFIDDKADQIIAFTSPTTPSERGIQIGMGVTTGLQNIILPGAGSTSVFNGYLKGIITGIATGTENNHQLEVKILSRVSSVVSTSSTVLSTTASAGADSGAETIYLSNTANISTGDLFSSGDNDDLPIIGVGSTSIDIDGGLTNAITLGDIVNINRITFSGGVESPISYAEGTDFASFTDTKTITVRNTGNSSISTFTASSVLDWYEEQTLGLDNATIYWKSIAPKPTTNRFVAERNGKNDALHIVVVDDKGTLTGNQGTLLEKHLGLSKAYDAVSAVNSPQKIWYEQYIADFSTQIYAGGDPSSAADTYWGTAPRATGFSASFTPITVGDGGWGQPAQDITFSCIGNKTYKLTGGQNYSLIDGEYTGMKVGLGDLMTSYGLFLNKDDQRVDYLVMGPGFDSREDSQAKASYLISIAEQRRDCIATIGPHKADLVGKTDTGEQTTNLVKYFSSLPSSSFAVFDSGYKYTYDRFNNKFRYIPTNPDIAGLMCRTTLNSYPWFSPAGQQRGIINNAIKLAYNPSKAQRDKLYPQRINPVVTQPGLGTLLFGDKTALGFASAFDRINVRRLFLTVEKALERAAQAQLFELNDELTRANFRNIVDPFLRDVQAKRGLYGYLVVCDETNNTPDIIDNNEFRADIYLKPTKSINYVTLTFVATRTGVSFEEVVGTV